MKTIIFSDTHFTKKFDRRRFELLADIISEADQVIINGDLWEGWKITFDDFIASKWNRLFPLLKEKSAVYIYGNHDPENLCDDRVSLFSVKQAHRYTLTVGENTFIVEHGDGFDMAYKKFAKSAAGVAFAHNPFVVSVSISFEKFLTKAHVLKYFYYCMGMNRAIKRRVLVALQPFEVYVCGHTHQPEYDYEHSFINSGFIRHGQAHYVVIGDGLPSLHKTTYTAKYIRRLVLATTSLPSY